MVIGGGIMPPRRSPCFTQFTHQLMAFDIAQHRLSNGDLTIYDCSDFISTADVDNYNYTDYHFSRSPKPDHFYNLSQIRSHESTTHFGGTGSLRALHSVLQLQLSTLRESRPRAQNRSFLFSCAQHHSFGSVVRQILRYWIHSVHQLLHLL